MKVLFVALAWMYMTSIAFANQKVVLITGASSGIGLATAKAFHEDGWQVWAGYRTTIPEELKNLPHMHFSHLDVTDNSLIEASVADILKEVGRIDALINNAGFGLIGAEECITIEEAQQVFDVNFFGAFRLIQAVLPTMRHQKSGHIINISSGAGVIGKPGLGLYSASKFALEGLTESMATTLSHWNIRVSIVEPGFVKTNGGKHCVFGSRKCAEPFYENLAKGWQKMISQPCGQSPEAVALLLVKIANTSEPNLRYQTTLEMTQGLSEIQVDPTGNRIKQKNQQFMHTLIQQLENKQEVDP